ncbi:hypothetical protein E3N88_00291 [Mikania micrantha]|uniref:Uncharacterized protein n=1 Tax=Mikania micrantha TaxID=192012 RepID=A0A5N6PXM1_9ASTR|nr:hypothetical protein E3N88_00291 [Mikania micrantha]
MKAGNLKRKAGEKIQKSWGSAQEEGTTNSSTDDDARSEHVFDDVHLTPGHFSESHNQKKIEHSTVCEYIACEHKA